MITYPVAPESRWSILQVSTSQIIARNVPWPRADGGAIEGLDPDFVYLLQSTDAKPDYDSRLYQLESTEQVDIEANTIRRTWGTTKRPLEDRLAAAENVEAEELSKHIKLEREVIETRLMVTALLNYIDGLQFPPKVKAMADAYKAKGTKLWKNRDRLKAIVTAIQADQDPDLESGWEAP